MAAVAGHHSGLHGATCGGRPASCGGHLRIPAKPRGLWPQYLDDLAPDFLPAPPRPDWFYELTPLAPAGNAAKPSPRVVPVLSALAPKEGPHTQPLGYDFDPAGPTWRIFGNENARILRTDPPHPLVSVPRTQATLAELDRRILREPANLEHRRARASLLVAEPNNLAEARVTLAAARRSVSAIGVAPAGAAATLDLPTTPSPAVPPSVQDFATWTQANGSFTHSYYLCWLYRQCHLEDLAAHVRSLQGSTAPHWGRALTTGKLRPSTFGIWPGGLWRKATGRWPLRSRTRGNRRNGTVSCTNRAISRSGPPPNSPKAVPPPRVVISRRCHPRPNPGRRIAKACARRSNTTIKVTATTRARYPPLSRSSNRPNKKRTRKPQPPGSEGIPASAKAYEPCAKCSALIRT